MEDYGYDQVLKRVSERYYDAEHEEVFKYRRMDQMEQMFSPAHKDDMLFEMKTFRAARYLYYQHKLKEFVR